MPLDRRRHRSGLSAGELARVVGEFFAAGAAAGAREFDPAVDAWGWDEVEALNAAAFAGWAPGPAEASAGADLPGRDR